MPADPHLVTTRQRAFLTEHGLNPDRVLPHRGIGVDGVTVVVLPGDERTEDGRLPHPWALRADVVARAGDFVRLVVPWPDPETRDAAIAARNGDWEETVGPEAAAIWRRLAE